MAAFKGWKAEAVEFFEGLEADNTKAYWQAHKGDYEKLVLQPMRDLLADLAGEFGEGNIFRPYRDVRFSADKSPYKTNIAAMIGEVGYVSFSSSGLGLGSGYYMMSNDQLDRYRRSVVDARAGKQLDGVIAALTKAGNTVTAHETLKSAPRGYAKDHPRIELLRLKGLIAWREWPVAAWMGTAKAEQRVLDFLHASAPLRKWLDSNVGPPETPRER